MATNGPSSLITTSASGEATYAERLGGERERESGLMGMSERLKHVSVCMSVA